MYPTAISQMLEAVAKLAFGLLFAWVVTYIGNKQFESSGMVFGKACETQAQAGAAIAPLASAAAICNPHFSRNSCNNHNNLY